MLYAVNVMNTDVFELLVTAQVVHILYKGTATRHMVTAVGFNMMMRDFMHLL